MRTTIVISACLAVVAQTSGLMLIVHLGSLAHPAHHNSEDCSVCRQSCVLSKKFLLGPPVELALQVHVRPENVPEFIERKQDHHPRVHQARAPPICRS